jgi:hypothetical protein
MPLFSGQIQRKILISIVMGSHLRENFFEIIVEKKLAWKDKGF